MKKVLSQDEIDAVFSGGGAARSGGEAAKDLPSDVSAFDLSHLDRIPKQQLRAIHLVHENFARNLGSTLSAYLRNDVALNLVSLDQASYGDFLENITFPTCMAYINLTPFEGMAVLEMNINMMFTLIELLMGAKGGSATAVQRKITDIEKSIMQTLMRLILRDLSEAWGSVTNIAFSVQSLASEPQLMQVLSPAEAVVVIAIDVRVGASSGLMNLALPAIFIKRLRRNFDQLQTIQRSPKNEFNPERMGQLLQDVPLQLDAVLDGGQISARELLDLEEEQVLVFDYPLDNPIQATINDLPKWNGKIALGSNNKLAFRTLDRFQPKKGKRSIK